VQDLRPAADRAADWIAARRRAGVLFVGLDFDGTLAPIVADPGAAAALPEARAAVAALARRSDCRVGVLSGRALDDVRTRLGIADVWYAGNHGFEIMGPGLPYRVHPGAQAARPALDRCLRRLAALAALPGVSVEDKGLSASVHVRNVPSVDVAGRAAAAVRGACAAEAALRVTEGLEVLELRPALAWDKGRALRFLLEALRVPDGAPVVFIGDDATDEDAFRALRGRGEGVIVGDPPRADTAATAWLRGPADVAMLLRALAA
jgi:trehalose-phosphatase